MYKFTTGLIAGSIITAAGITCIMSNNSAKKKIMKAAPMYYRGVSSKYN